MVKIALMQPYIFPYLGYFQLINAVDKFIFYDDVNFIKQGWISRNYILLEDKPHLYTVPLDGASSFRKINEIELGKYFDIWRSKFIKKIEAAYRRAPYFDSICEVIQMSIAQDGKKISELSALSVENVCRYLNLNTKLTSSSFENYQNQSLRGQERVLDICRSESATDYVNAIGGIDLYSKEVFANNGIRLTFLKSKPITYKQFSNSFASNLSIIDVLMFNSKEKVRELVQQYELI